MKILTGTGKNNSRQRKNIYPTSFCLVPTALQQKWSSQSCFSALVKNPFNVADKSLNISLFRVTMGASNLLMCFVYIERKKEWLRDRERERKRENKKTEERKRIIKKEREREKAFDMSLLFGFYCFQRFCWSPDKSKQQFSLHKRREKRIKLGLVRTGLVWLSSNGNGSGGHSSVGGGGEGGIGSGKRLRRGG